MRRMRKRKTAKECELKRDVTKQNSVTKKKSFPPKYIRGRIIECNILSAAENKIMRRSSLNQGNNLIENNQCSEKKPALIQFNVR